MSAVPLDPSMQLGDNTSPSARANGVSTLNGCLPTSRPDPAPIVHAELFIDRFAADAGDADATACGEVVADALAAAAAYVGDCLVPAERPKAWDFFSPGLILRVPDGSVWTGWPSREEFSDSGPNGTFAAMSAAFGARSLLNLEWTAMRALQVHCVPLDRNTVIVHAESVVSMVDHEAGGVHRDVQALFSDTLIRNARARYGWVVGVRDYRHVGAYIAGPAEERQS